MLIDHCKGVLHYVPDYLRDFVSVLLKLQRDPSNFSRMKYLERILLCFRCKIWKNYWRSRELVVSREKIKQVLQELHHLLIINCSVDWSKNVDDLPMRMCSNIPHVMLKYGFMVPQNSHRNEYILRFKNLFTPWIKWLKLRHNAIIKYFIQAFKKSVLSFRKVFLSDNDLALSIDGCAPETRNMFRCRNFAMWRSSQKNSRSTPLYSLIA